MIDTFRFLIENTRNIEVHDWITLCRSTPYMPLSCSEWLWATGSSYMHEDSVHALQNFCIRGSLRLLHDPLTRKPAIDFLKRAVTPHVIRQMELDSIDWLNILFSCSLLQFESFDVGKAFFDVFLHAKVDIEMLIQRSLQADSTFGGMEEENIANSPYRQVIFECTEELGWILGWRWEHDNKEPGFLVVSEFSTLGTEVERYHPYGDLWPYVHQDTNISWADRQKARLLKMKRFDRGMASKARKEFSRSGQRRVRSKMPGSWIN
jgi:hypothetical protein